jgi:RNA polymerase sigma-70 factor (ECF subfamily)
MSEGMDAALAEALSAGRIQWPGVTLPLAALAEHVGRQSLSSEVVRQRGPDLYLAAACAAGEPAALAAFEQEHLTRVDSYVARIGLTPEMLDELRQALRIRLLLDQPPRIGTYRGTGPLGGWVRMAAMRVAWNLLDAAAVAGARVADDGELAARVAEAAPESELLRARCRPVLQAAVERAIGALDDRDKALLRFHYVEGLSVDTIGTFYRVHRATAARWLVDLRHRLMRAVRRTVAAELRLSPSEFRSLVRTLDGELRVSVSRALRA